MKINDVMIGLAIVDANLQTKEAKKLKNLKIRKKKLNEICNKLIENLKKYQRKENRN